MTIIFFNLLITSTIIFLWSAEGNKSFPLFFLFFVFKGLLSFPWAWNMFVYVSELKVVLNVLIFANKDLAFVSVSYTSSCRLRIQPAWQAEICYWYRQLCLVCKYCMTWSKHWNLTSNRAWHRNHLLNLKCKVWKQERIFLLQSTTAVSALSQTARCSGACVMELKRVLVVSQSRSSQE